MLPDEAGALRLLERVQARDHVKNHFVVQSIPAGVDRSVLGSMSIDELWALHDQLHERFLEVRKGPLVSLHGNTPNYLDVKTMIARLMLKSCCYCERCCGVNRAAGMKGTCGVGATSRVFSAFLHFGEEVPLVPSGTIFFAGCNFACVFCQNNDISADPLNGIPVTPQKLADLATRLHVEGAKNINYVGGDPTPNMHVIIESLAFQDILAAQLWNSNAYNTESTMSLLLDLIDIWLPDMKYGSDDCALRLSGIPHYLPVVKRNLKLVHDHMVSPGHASLVIRHLVLPSHVDCCSVPVIEWIAKELPLAMVNIMGQYRPCHVVNSRPKEYVDIARRPTRTEIDAVRSYAARLGVKWKSVS